MEKVEAYGILVVPKDATPTEITKAWRTLNKQYHPDKFRHLLDSEIKDVEDHCKKINSTQN